LVSKGKLFVQPVGTPLAGRIPSRRAARRKQTKDMSTLTAKGNWNIAKGKLKQKFARLADDDLQFAEGKEDELLGRIQKRTGQAKDKIERTVDECCGCKH
jgi:uncharacterized protein YjbJ (UPF0337 family)